MPAGVLVTVVTDAFAPRNGRRTGTLPWKAGAPLADYFPADVRHAPPERLMVSRNGAAVPPALWGETPVQPGDGIAVTIMPGYGTVLMLAYAAASIAYNVYSGKKKEKKAGKRAQRAAQALEDSIQLGYDGIFPTTQPGRRIPVLYGQMRVAGQCVYSQSFVDGSGKRALDATFGISHGEVNGMVAGSVQINGQALSLYPGVTTDTQVGTNSQAASTVVKPFLAASVRNTPGNQLLSGGAAVLYVTQLAMTGFRLSLNFPNGMYAVINTRSSPPTASTIWTAEATFTVRTRSYPSGSFGAATTFKTGFRQFSAFTASYQSGPLTADRYEIEIKWTTTTTAAGRYGGASPTVPAAVTCFLSVVEEVSEVTQIYPNLATLNLHAVASAAIGGAVPLVTSIWQGRKVQVWNGDTPATFTNTYTRSPAWIIYDLLTNTEYGAGRYVTVSEIDLPSFASAATFCATLVNTPDGGTEARSLCDFYLDGEMDVFEAIGLIAAAAKCQVVRGFGNLKLIPDGTGSAVQLFTMGNIVPGSYRHGYLSHRLVPNRVSVDFLNADQDYHRDVAQTEDPLVLVNSEEVVDLEVEAIGVTRHTQATRIAKWAYLDARYQREQIEFEVGADALALEWGDVFIFVHETTRPGEFFSGRVGEGSTTGVVKLDQPIRVPIPTAPQEWVDIHVRYLSGDGNNVQELASIRKADYNQMLDLLTLESASGLTYAPVKGDLWAVFPRTTVYEQRKYWKVVDITRTQAHRRKITAIPYRTEAYEDADILPSDIILSTDYATPS